ncbi:type IV pili methyl-accepting chemotaxis transducer N-terminal domain-containing protein [Ramlibacter sp.]|uniref:type IV pili methyl-accepting chemotaxis transducer N-terminal domain-containing protein n=1 Tax=Ramlibacter sp. TaxID=1917967 RepID=UPI0017E475DF|nr:type IV pili methyl-accepting chemotaxis transducer N-terminal domain-containing protein [Ramlibacter sp.]MBA2675583.1 type IV pili methyl-accepting chemotaxis transducer N-terminal domain-containing protein [Ramlibacter sp.]
MCRRTLIGSAGLAALGLPPSLRAQVLDLGDAINKAGRQRMLSQRMSKAYLALVQNVERTLAQQALDKSIALFDRQLVELKAFAPAGELRGIYDALEAAWGEYKGALVGAPPVRADAPAVMANAGRVLALAHKGTVQYETLLDKPIGKLVNLAGRQRMLSQRMAAFYLASVLPIDPAGARQEIAKARAEFVAALELLRNAPEATVRIREQLQLGDAQWVLFDSALRRTAPAGSVRPLSEVFVASENLLQVMDRVTGLYAELKT